MVEQLLVTSSPLVQTEATTSTTQSTPTTAAFLVQTEVAHSSTTDLFPVTQTFSSPTEATAFSSAPIQFLVTSLLLRNTEPTLATPGPPSTFSPQSDTPASVPGLMLPVTSTVVVLQTTTTTAEILTSTVPSTSFTEATSTDSSPSNMATSRQFYAKPSVNTGSSSGVTMSQESWLSDLSRRRWMEESTDQWPPPSDLSIYSQPFPKWPRDAVYWPPTFVYSQLPPRPEVPRGGFYWPHLETSTQLYSPNWPSNNLESLPLETSNQMYESLKGSDTNGSPALFEGFKGPADGVFGPHIERFSQDGRLEKPVASIYGHLTEISTQLNAEYVSPKEPGAGAYGPRTETATQLNASTKEPGAGAYGPTTETSTQLNPSTKEPGAGAYGSTTETSTQLNASTNGPGAGAYGPRTETSTQLHASTKVSGAGAYGTYETSTQLHAGTKEPGAGAYGPTTETPTQLTASTNGPGAGAYGPRTETSTQLHASTKVSGAGAYGPTYETSTQLNVSNNRPGSFGARTELSTHQSAPTNGPGAGVYGPPLTESSTKYIHPKGASYGVSWPPSGDGVHRPPSSKGPLMNIFNQVSFPGFATGQAGESSRY
jgi:hypothetical protein